MKYLESPMYRVVDALSVLQALFLCGSWYCLTLNDFVKPELLLFSREVQQYLDSSLNQNFLPFKLKMYGSRKMFT